MRRVNLWRGVLNRGAPLEYAGNPGAGRLFLLPVFQPAPQRAGAFQMFAQSMLLTNGGPEMTTRGVVSLIYDTAFGDYRLGYGAAISWLLFLLIAGFSLIQFRLIRRVTD